MEWVFTKGAKEFQFEWVCDAVDADPSKLRNIIRTSLNNGEKFVQSTYNAKLRFLG